MVLGVLIQARKRCRVVHMFGALHCGTYHVCYEDAERYVPVGCLDFFKKKPACLCRHLDVVTTSLFHPVHGSKSLADALYGVEGRDSLVIRSLWV